MEVNLVNMSDNQYNFLKAQVKAFHPNWSEEQVDAECKKIIEKGDSNSSPEEDTDCLYCGS
jgi:hypothetical protein